MKSPGMLIRDGGVVYAGSLKRRDSSKVFGIFSLDGGRGSDMLTIGRKDFRMAITARELMEAPRFEGLGKFVYSRPANKKTIRRSLCH